MIADNKPPKKMSDSDEMGWHEVQPGAVLLVKRTHLQVKEVNIAMSQDMDGFKLILSQTLTRKVNFRTLSVHGVTFETSVAIFNISVSATVEQHI